MEETLKELLREAQSNLGSAIRQSAPSDDQLIFARMEKAYAHLKDALIVLEKQPHIHRGGGSDIDECGLCGHDIRHDIHTSV